MNERKMRLISEDLADIIRDDDNLFLKFNGSENCMQYTFAKSNKILYAWDV